MVVTAVVWGAKLSAIGVGLAIAAAGMSLAVFGAPLVASLNRLYAHLPGHFRYPMWWHRLVGGLIAGIGLLIAILGGTLAGRA